MSLTVFVSRRHLVASSRSRGPFRSAAVLLADRLAGSDPRSSFVSPPRYRAPCRFVFPVPSGPGNLRCAGGALPIWRPARAMAPPFGSHRLGGVASHRGGPSFDPPAQVPGTHRSRRSSCRFHGRPDARSSRGTRSGAAGTGAAVGYGIDPAEELARALARRSGLPIVTPLRAPLWWGRQAARARGRRSAPRFEVGTPPPTPAVLVDDVATTGATLTAAAAALGSEFRQALMAPAPGGVVLPALTDAGEVAWRQDRT